MAAVSNILNKIFPAAQKTEDGRDQWPSRAAFILAAMGGAVGLGNLLRYPSVVFANNGLQWFIPYLIALFFLGMPLLLLEISIGQAYRGGSVVAFGHLAKRTKGIGLATIFTGYVVVTYYVPILAWVMVYFRYSFQSPLPWKEDNAAFYLGTVIANGEPVVGDDGWVSYPSSGVIGETLGWTAFVWFVVYLCMFKGVGLTGRVVYATMGLPLVIVIILLGRSVSLDNAQEGIKLYFATWNGEKLANGAIWQAACGQIFFSIGTGFGYYTAYASYNSKFSNAVQDSVIVAMSNSTFEVIAAFAVFGVIGNLGLQPDGDTNLGTFTVAFLTYPEAIANMPGSNVWAVLFFLTLMFLGISSSFALVEGIVTLFGDSAFGVKFSRTMVSTAVVFVSFLLSILYTTRFGFYLLDAVDTWTNNLALIFTMWAECVAVTTLYRYKDIVGQVGMPAYMSFTATYLGSQIIGIVVAHTVSPEAGAGVWGGLLIGGSIVSVLIAKQPEVAGPWGSNKFISAFWWLSSYSGNQLTRDLNTIVATGNNWAIPVFWAPTLRWIASPILMIVLAFAYPAFYKLRKDPLHIFAFSVAHVAVILVVMTLIIPRALDVFLPPGQDEAWEKQYATAPLVDLIDGPGIGDADSSQGSSENEKDKAKH